jgi:hypothetical protein
MSAVALSGHSARVLHVRYYRGQNSRWLDLSNDPEADIGLPPKYLAELAHRPSGMPVYVGTIPCPNPKGRESGRSPAELPGQS